MPNQMILQSAGPLPITTTFNASGTNEPCDFFVSGTAYAAAAPIPLAINVLLDGQLIGSIQVWANEADSHRSLVSTFSQVAALSSGQHQLTLEAAPNVVTDDHDQFAVTLIY